MNQTLMLSKTKSDLYSLRNEEAQTINELMKKSTYLSTLSIFNIALDGAQIVFCESYY